MGLLVITKSEGCCPEHAYSEVLAITNSLETANLFMETSIFDSRFGVQFSFLNECIEIEDNEGGYLDYSIAEKPYFELVKGEGNIKQLVHINKVKI